MMQTLATSTAFLIPSHKYVIVGCDAGLMHSH